MIDNEVAKYRTKKPSSVSKAANKAKHKHVYSPCKFSYSQRYDIPGKDAKVYEFKDLGTYCVICGKIGNRSFLHSVEDSAKFDQQNPNAPIFDVNGFCDKFVEIVNKD